MVSRSGNGGHNLNGEIARLRDETEQVVTSTGALARITRVPVLWHVRYTSVPPAVAPLHRRLSGGTGVRPIDPA